MKTKRYPSQVSSHYSLEERMVEPFRAIRWISVSNGTKLLGAVGLFGFMTLWWVFKNQIFLFWGNTLQFLVTLIREPWIVSYGSWPENHEPLMEIPKLTAGILPPFVETWWMFLVGTVVLWILSEPLKSAFLPLKAITRFIIFLIWISLACFAISPLSFKHSVEEWSKIYFLGAYGSFLVYSIVWVMGVLGLPISTWKKVTITLALLVFELFATPIALFISTMILKESSLLLLPLFALLFAPLLQLGWFVSFYSYALSSGGDPSKDVQLE